MAYLAITARIGDALVDSVAQRTIDMPTQEHREVKVETSLPDERKFLEEARDFSLVLGGPFFQLFRKAHLEGDHLELLTRRILILTLIAWLPLLILTLISSGGTDVRLSFFHDVEVHVRFLIALPVLIAAELIVHLRIRPIVARFVDWRIVLPHNLPLFNKAIQSAMKLRNSIALEVGLLVCVYTGGLLLWHRRIAIDVATWYAMPGGRWQLTPAGWWYVFISIPILQFILLRWYARFFIWFRFLWQVSKIDLNLIPTHPDRAAGLAFLGKSVYALSPILFAQGTMLAGLVASRVLYRGEQLQGFALQIGGFIAFFVLAILGPLVMFTSRLVAVRRKGMADYGQLAQRYVERFDQRWVRGEAASNEELLGTADIQSLADLGNSYALVREMRYVPFGLEDISRLAAVTAAPFLPLMLTIWSPEELILRIIRVVF
jgi:hypothetical protein